MSFLYSPTRLLTPKTPNGYPSANNSEMWVGTGNDRGFVVFRADRQWRMAKTLNGSVGGAGSATLFPAIVVDGVKLWPVYRDCGGFLYFSNNARAVWFVEGIGWVYMGNGSPGYVPEEYTDENGDPAGDDFYTVSFPYSYSDDTVLQLKPRGRLSGGTEKTATFFWERWDGPTTGFPFGAYNPKGGASGTKVMGCPRWRDGSGNYYIRSLKQVLGKWSYGAIHYENGKRLIGSVGAVNGWYEGSEPSLTSSVTFRFCKPEGSEVTGSDRTVTFVDRVEGEDTTEALLGEVAIWH